MAPNRMGGVQAFLVIGAYFLTRKYLKGEQSSIKVGEAFVHRIKRLYPAYVTLIIVSVVLVYVSSHQVNIDSLWYLFSLQNFRCLFDGTWNSLEGYLGHFWYLGLDVWLFLLWVVMIRLVPKKQLRLAFVISLIFGIFWRTSFILLKPDTLSIAYVVPVGQLDCWSIGGLVALSTNDEGNNKRLTLVDFVVGTIGVVFLIGYNAIQHDCSIGEGYQLFHSASGYMKNPITGNIHFFIALMSAGILRYCLDTSRKHPILSSVPLVALGGMTYELYCFHLPILALMRHFVNNPLLLVFVALLVTYAVSWLWCRFAMPVINKILK